MDKSSSINKLKLLKETAKSLLEEPVHCQNYHKWYRDTEVALEKIFGNNCRHVKDLDNISFSLSIFSTATPNSAFDNAYYDGVKKSVTLLSSIIDEVEEYWDEENIQKKQELTAIDNIKTIINRFHKIARQLQSRYSNRPTIEIDDEYDVQDLFHALLQLYFDDIRPEEYTPSYAGAASRVDFLIKQESIVIEIKKTRKGLRAKQVGEELLIDSQRYQAHPDCGQLICFVYDPEGRIANPRGIENDLSKELNGVPISVFITPE